MILLILLAVAGLVVKIAEEKSRKELSINFADLMKFSFFFISLIVGYFFSKTITSPPVPDGLDDAMKERFSIGWWLAGCAIYAIIAEIVGVITVKIYRLTFGKGKKNRIKNH